MQSTLNEHARIPLSLLLPSHLSSFHFASLVDRPRARIMPEPIAKKRKLESVRQDSFSHVLQQLEAEEDASAGRFPSTKLYALG
jgi:hypothetical protein